MALDASAWQETKDLAEVYINRGGHAYAFDESECYWGDSRFIAEGSIEDLADTIRRSASTKLLNTAWIKHMRTHGFQGAQSAASRVNNLFKWSATSGEVSKQLFDDVARTYIMDEENRAWLREENPYALEKITRRLL